MFKVQAVRSTTRKSDDISSHEVLFTWPMFGGGGGEWGIYLKAYLTQEAVLDKGQALPQ